MALFCPHSTSRTSSPSLKTGLTRSSPCSELAFWFDVVDDTFGLVVLVDLADEFELFDWLDLAGMIFVDAIDGELVTLLVFATLLGAVDIIPDNPCAV